MKVSVHIPFQASISFENDQIEAVGSKYLLQKLSELLKIEGPSPRLWKSIHPADCSESILINEFIQKINQIPWAYSHEELCHCRLINTESVCNAIKAGCRTVADVSRTTLAGTGCGSCRKDIQTLIQSLTD
jgi:bacterioferritin-associated ferredoxin